MKSKLLLAIALLLLLPLAATAQQAPTAAMGPAVAPPVLLSGTYRGDVTNKSNGGNVFELVARQDGKNVEGTLRFWKGDVACRTQVPISGGVRDDGSIVLEAMGAMKGCERTFTLKFAADGQLTGEVVGPLGQLTFILTKI